MRPTNPLPAGEGPVRAFLVGLRVTAADYLRTKQMIVQLDDNELHLSDAHLWAEPPEAGFKRVLAQRFAQDLPDCQLASMPLSTTNRPELILEIELHSLQGRLTPGKTAEVSAELRILDANSHLLDRRQLRGTAPWNPTGLRFQSNGPGPSAPHAGGDYAALAAAESRAAASLAGQIIECVKEKVKSEK